MKSRLLLALLLCRAINLHAADTNTPATLATNIVAGPYILTPPAPDKPRINGPDVFGVRPGSPFLYTIPATGDRPMTFSAMKLPRGLKLDSKTGRITGKLMKKGETAVTLVAQNALGKAEKKFRIVCGDRIALTPPMGWNSWNCFAGAVSEDKVKSAADAMVKSGLINHGWTYINIDDTWQGRRGGKFNGIQPNEKFPDMKSLCDQVHALGLKVGIYSTPFVTSYAEFIGGTAENPEGTWEKPRPKAPRNVKILPFAVGKFSFATNDARQWAAWGMDYLKYDWYPIETPQVEEMAGALRSTKRDIVLSLSNNERGKVLDVAPEISKTAQSWRTTRDITDTWRSMSGIGFNQNAWTRFAGPGHWNDPDMLVVGQVGWGRLHPTRLTPDEQYTHISLWCLLSAPLLIGCDMTRLDDFTLNLLENDEVLALDQDALGKEATCITSAGDLRVYEKELEDGGRAVGFFNLGLEPMKMGFKDFAKLGLTGRQHVRDLWRQQDLPDINDPANDSFPVTIPAHGVVLCKFTAAR